MHRRFVGLGGHDAGNTDLDRWLLVRKQDFVEALPGAHAHATQTSEQRLERYREAVAGASTLDELIPVMADLWEEDRAAGHVRVVSQMVAGSVNRPELGRQIVALMEPWIELAEATLARVLPGELPARELGYATVVFYLGVNLMTHLDPEHERTDALFARARELAPLLTPLFAV